MDSTKPPKKSRQQKPWRGDAFGLFSRAEIWAQDRALREGPNALLIYVALCRLEFECPSDYKSAFLASARDIAAVSGLSARTVKAYLPRLANCGVIVVHTGRNPKGAHSKNRITLLAAPKGYNPTLCNSRTRATASLVQPKRAKIARNSNSHAPKGAVDNTNGAAAIACASGLGGPARRDAAAKENELHSWGDDDE